MIFKSNKLQQYFLLIKEIIIIYEILMHSLFRNTFCKQL